MQLLTWDVGKINPQKLPSLKGTMCLQAGASKPDENPTINIQFKIQQMAISGATHSSVIGVIQAGLVTLYPETLYPKFIFTSFMVCAAVIWPLGGALGLVIAFALRASSSQVVRVHMQM